MAITELYVDPSIAGNSGTGIVGDPYGDLEWCLSQATFDDTNGTRINIKSGTAEILSAALDLATNFTVGGGPSATAPLIFQGYSSASNDGDWAAQTGIGGIDCNNKSLFAATSNSYITLRHLEIFGRAGAGYAYLIYTGAFSSLIECEVHTHSGTQPMVRLGNHTRVSHCHFRNATSAEACLRVDTANYADSNYFNLGGSCVVAIQLGNNGAVVSRNIIRLADNVSGINLAQDSGRAVNNSIFSASGTGNGIYGVGASTVILNNVVEGFSGGGGVGIEKTSGVLAEYGGNHCYNNTTNYNVTVPIITNHGDNEDLSGSSPFADASGQDFTPQDIGNMKELAFPPSIVAGDAGLTAVMKMWKGALEPAGGAGVGGLLVHPGTSGGARG